VPEGFCPTFVPERIFEIQNTKVMKNKLFIAAVILGVFLMIDTSLLAQDTGTSTSTSRSSSRVSPTSRARTTVVVPPVPAVPDLEDIEMHDYTHGYSYTTSSSVEKSSKLSLSKRYEGTSTTKKGTFKVDEGVRKIRISISGRVESGKITVELYLPNEKEVGTFTIDDTADIDWSQSITVEEDETKYYGEWSFNIKAQEAHGRYSLSLSTY
jgi:hypothetical protein